MKTLNIIKLFGKLYIQRLKLMEDEGVLSKNE